MKSSNLSRYSPYIAGYALRQLGKVFAFGLGDIENIGRAEPNQCGLILGADILLGLCIFLPANADDRSKYADAALSLLYLAAKLVPRIQASDAGRVWPLSGDLKDVAK